MDRTEQPLLLVMPRCGFTGSCLRISVSQSEAERNPSRVTMLARWLCIALVALTMLPMSATADWIRWEPGFRATTGKAVISVDGNPATDGIANIYHFHRENFEAVLDWRAGDVLHTTPEEPTQWIYTVSEDSDDPIQITIRLSHILGYETLQLVDEVGSAIACRVLMGDLLEIEGSDDQAPGSLSYRLQLFRAGKELTYADDPDGIDYSDAPGMTFHAGLVAPLLSGTARAQLNISESGAYATPAPGTTTASHLAAATFGIGAPNWDKIVLTFSDNTGSGTIRAGTQMRVMLSGVPLARSSHAVPCTSDPLPPLIYYSADQPLHFDVTGISNPGGGGSITFRDPESGSLIASLTDTLPLRQTVRAELSLNADRVVPSDSYLNVTLEAGGYFNNQPSMVLVAERYTATRLDALLEHAWARQPAPWPSQKPIGRPLWESSMSLCDKLDPAVDGIAIVSSKGQFNARHLNARRTAFGSLAGETDESFPAIWRQREKSPVILSTESGRAECANDQLRCRVGGQRASPNGIMRPAVWTENGEKWIETLLPVPAFCIGGNILGINDNGEACGFVEVKIARTANLLPCVWTPKESGGYERPAVLPTLEDAMSGVAVDINRRGTIVGYTEGRDGNRRASRWNPTDTGWAWEDLGVDGVATSINWLGTIVGGSIGKTLLWQCDERIEINPLVDRSGESRLARVFAIGELGDILGQSSEGKMLLLQPQTTLEF